MHNGRLANPLDPFQKDLKKVTGKRGKTDADVEEISRREFFGGIYWNSELGPHIPDMILQRAVEEGAKKFKLGKQFKSAVFVDGDSKLEYSGPRNVEELYNDQTHVSREMVKVGTSKCLRTRPMFPIWELTTKIVFDESVVEEQQVQASLEMAGRFVGIGDWRPRYGRFSVSKV